MSLLAAVGAVASPAGAVPVAAAGDIVVPCTGAGGNATAADLAALRDAVVIANVNAGPDTIRLADNCVYTFTDAYSVGNRFTSWFGPAALPAIGSDITIEGRGATIRRDPTVLAVFRLLFVGADPAGGANTGYVSPGAARLELRDLTLGNGYARGGNAGFSGGGGAGMGGAIFNEGTLVLNRVTIRDSVARGGSGSGLTPLGGMGGGGGVAAGAGLGGGGGFGVGFPRLGSSGGAGGGSQPPNIGDPAGAGGGGGGFASTAGGAAGSPSGDGGNGGGSLLPGTGGRGGSLTGVTGGNGGDGAGGGGASGKGTPFVGWGGPGGDGGRFGFGGYAGAGGAGGAVPSPSGGGGGGGGVGGGGGPGGTGAPGSGIDGGPGGAGGGGGFGGGGGAGGLGGDSQYADLLGTIGPGNGGSGGAGGFGGFGGGGGGGGRGGFSAGANGAAAGVTGAAGPGGVAGFGGGNGTAGFSDVSGGGGGGAGMGGAIFNHQGQVTIYSSTLSANIARGGDNGRPGIAGAGGNGRGLGAGIFNLNGKVTIDSSTIAFNKSAEGGAGIYTLGYFGGDGAGCAIAACLQDAMTEVRNSIVSNSTDETGGAVADVVAVAPATVSNGGVNLAASSVDFGDRSVDIVRSSQTAGGGVIVGSPSTADPRLDPVLRTNMPSPPGAFDPPPTHAITRVSPAFDAGATLLTYDERGLTRPAVMQSDIGAFEFSLITPTLTLTALPATTGVGSDARAQATMSGGSQTTGTVSFALYPPSDTACSGTPVATSTITLAGGEALSSYTPPLTTFGIYRWQATYSGDANNKAVTGPCGGATVDVGKATPTMPAGALPSGAVLGDPVSASAALNGGSNPTGTITFRLYSPSDPTCTGTPLFVSTQPVVSSQAHADQYTPTQAGAFRWQVSYSGDSQNNAVTSPCGGTSLTVTVDSRSTLATTAVPAVAPLGQAIHAEATLVGANNPTGNVTFTLYRPTDTSCYDPIFTSVVPIASDGTATSGAFTTVFSPSYIVLGTYSWMATYPGDANNLASVVQSCGAVGQTVTVGKATPVVTGQVAASEVPYGQSIRIVATVTGGVYLTSDTAFDLFASTDPGCTGAPAWSRSVPLSGSQGTSPPVSPAVGVYHWRITQAGDAFNESATSGCGGPTQTVTVVAIVPKVTVDSLTPSPATVGQPVHAVVTVSGGVGSGRIRFAIYGPTDAAGPCLTAPFAWSVRIIDGDGESLDAIRGDGTFTSADFTPTAPGTYWWRAFYDSTNALNGSAEEQCGPNGTLTVNEAPAGVVVTGGDLSLVESGPTATYTVVLASPPKADVEIGPVATGLCSVSGPLTFTPDNWNVPQTFTVTPGNDNLVHSQSCTVAHVALSLDPAYDGVQVASASGPVTEDDHANVAPQAHDDAYSTAPGVPLVVPAPGVLQNDSDADLDLLSAVLVVAPSHGSVTLSADGAFYYSPEAGFSGTDSFAYTAIDASLGSPPATVRITVSTSPPPPPPPVVMPPPPVVTPPARLVITPVRPARLADTRASGVTVDGAQRTERVGPNGALEVSVAGRGGVPSDASAVVLNVTVVNPGGPGFVTLFPCGSARPTASNLNYTAGQTVANSVFVGVGDAGKVCVYSSAATDIVVDANGYVPARGTPGAVAPARLADTRSSGVTVDGAQRAGGRVGANDALEVSVAGRGGVPSDASAVVLNVTVVNPGGPGFVTVFPCGSARPTASNLNYTAGQTVANSVFVGVGDAGKVCVYSSAAADIVVDADGHVPADSAPEAVTPGRLLDTRTGGATADPPQRVGASGVVEVPVAGRGGVSSDASRVFLSVTVVNPGGPGFVTVFPCGSARPTASNLNYTAGQTVANSVFVGLGDGGSVCVYSSAATDIVVDVGGYA